jgi:oxygen-dependent protoporphyrinogen oxidase
MTEIDVTIVGGGISGLAAARELCRAGLAVRLLEREPHCGGVIRTDTIDGFVIDSGPDTLLGHKPAAIALCRDLGLEPWLVSPLAPRTTYVLRGGRLRPLPETSAMGLPTDWRTLVTTRAFSWLGKLRMAAEPAIRRGSAPDESIASFIGRRFGREAVTYLGEPLLAGIHRGDASRLSLPALFPALADAERSHGSVVRSWRPFAPTSSSARTASVSLRDGLGRLVATLADTLPPGVAVPSADVRRVEHDGAWVTRLADGRAIRSRAVLLSVPAHAAGALVQTVDEELGRLCDGIRHAPSVTVAMGYRAAAAREAWRGWGVVVPASAGLRVGSATWVTSKWPHRAPPDHVLIRASLARACASEALEASDACVQSWVADELRRLFGIGAEPTMVKVQRWPRAMPQLEVGHLARMAAIEARLSALPGLFVSAAGFRGVGIPHCVADATTHARRAIAHVARAARH